MHPSNENRLDQYVDYFCLLGMNVTILTHNSKLLKHNRCVVHKTLRVYIADSGHDPLATFRCDLKR